MTANIGPTARLGTAISRASNKSLDQKVFEKAAMLLLDGLGLALAARNEKTVLAIQSLSSRLSGDGSARIWGAGIRSSLPEAVAANAVAVHAHFNDDSELMSWTHPASLVTPVAVSLGEANDSSLYDIVKAVATGYSTLAWLGANEKVALGLIHRGVRTSPTLGTLGAAAAASVILRANPEQARSAVGIAASITGGILEPVRAGSDDWRIQNAHSARGGLLAAQLAMKGVTGAPEGLEGSAGLLRAYADQDSVPETWNTDPDPSSILQVVAKPFSTLGDNMAAAIAAKVAYDRGVDIKRVRRLTVRIWDEYANYPGTSYKGPFDRVAQALASTAFAAAAMLVHGRLEYDISEDFRGDPQILALVSVANIEVYPNAGPFEGSVEIEYDDGTTLVAEAKDAPSTLLFHDPPTAVALFERRLVKAGLAGGLGKELAARLLQQGPTGPSLSVREWLDLGNI
jgi:2-methylcitrate dehydratase PrpD